MEANDKASVDRIGNVIKKISDKRIFIGIAIVAAVALLLGFGIYNSPENRMSRQLDLGQKYLEEQNYEQAIVAFNEVIEIDDRCLEAYLGGMEAYAMLGDAENQKALYEKALGKVREFSAEEIETDKENVILLYLEAETVYAGDDEKILGILQEGYALTGDERLRIRIEALELLKGDTSIVNQNESENVQVNEGLDNIYLFETLDDLAVDILSQLGTVGEFNFVGASYDEFTRYLMDNYDGDEDNKDGTHLSGFFGDFHFSASIEDDTSRNIIIDDGCARLLVDYYENYISYDVVLILDDDHCDVYSEPKILNFPLLYQDWDEFFSKYVPWKSLEIKENLLYNDEIWLCPDYDSSNKTWLFQDQSGNTVQFSFSEFEDSSLNNRYILIDTTRSYMNGANNIHITFNESEWVNSINIIFYY